MGEMAREGGGLLVKEETTDVDSKEWEEFFNGSISSVIIMKLKSSLQIIYSVNYVERSLNSEIILISQRNFTC